MDFISFCISNGTSREDNPPIKLSHFLKSPAKASYNREFMMDSECFEVKNEEEVENVGQ